MMNPGIQAQRDRQFVEGMELAIFQIAQWIGAGMKVVAYFKRGKGYVSLDSLWSNPGATAGPYDTGKHLESIYARVPRNCRDKHWHRDYIQKAFDLDLLAMRQESESHVGKNIDDETFGSERWWYEVVVTEKGRNLFLSRHDGRNKDEEWDWGTQE